VYFASEVLDGRINFVDQLHEQGFEHLEKVWFGDVIKMKAYFRWVDRGRNSKQSDEERLKDYFYACHYYRWRLLDERSKYGPEYFKIVDAYIQNVADGVKKKLASGKCEEKRAERYVVNFYYNIGPAVLRGDEESKKSVVEAILESEGPSSPSSIMNALEAAIAIYFLRDPKGLPEEWYHQAKDFEDKALWRRAENMGM
jgi:hypothetical protein